MILKKRELPRLNALKGRVNDAEFEGHKAGTLMFLGFRGRHIGDGNYEGELAFTEVLPGDDKACSFTHEMRSIPEKPIERSFVGSYYRRKDRPV